MVPSMVNEYYIIRFAVCAKHATDDDMHVAFRTIQKHADIVLAEYRAQRSGQQSASADSLESPVKRASVTSLVQDIAVAEETVDPEALPETQVAPTIYPGPRIRVMNRKLQETKQ